MKNVSMTLRVDESVKRIWKDLAEKEGRSLASYIERVILMMRDRELLMESSALDVIADRLVTISNRLEEMTLQNSKKFVKANESKRERDRERDRELLDQVISLDLPESLTLEAWKTWVIYLRAKKNNKLDVATAKKILERWQLAEDNGYDLDELVEIAIQRNNADAVYESHIDKPKGGGKTVADAQSRIFDECVNARRV
jgi:hypothetical protein